MSFPHGISTRIARTGSCLLIALLAGACASAPEDPVAQAMFLEANDPAVGVNRLVFDFNVILVDTVVDPVATAYVTVVPEFFREGISNLLGNLRMPSTILNSALQGDWDNTGTAFGSFLINSTAGIGGLFDIPGSFGHGPRKEDFGQTLATWGMDPGIYLVLPLLGPSNVRDLVGRGGDVLTDPLTYVLGPIWGNVRTGVSVIHLQSVQGEKFDRLRSSSLDFYAAMRSLYRQQRAADISNGATDPFGFDDPYVEEP